MTRITDDILQFWFGELDSTGLCRQDHNSLWFSASADTDSHCRNVFGDAVQQALACELNDWAQSDEGLIALILLLDQFTRNIYRGTAHAFSGDSLALQLSQEAIATGSHHGLPAIHRVFLYLPLEHSENLAVQEACVELFAQLAGEMNSPAFTSFHRYAVAHHQVIAQFGRFPHRNASLDRPSTDAELSHLEVHKGF